MSDREPTRWQHSCINPQQVFTMIMLYDKNAHIVIHALFNNCGQGYYLLIVVYLHVTWKNTRVKTITTIYSQRVMGVEVAEDICDYAAI